MLTTEARDQHDGGATTGRRAAIVLVVSGPLDVYTARAFDRTAASWDPEGGAVIVDLRGATLIDSAGLRALVRLRNASARAGLVLGLVGPREMARRLARAGLDTGVVRGPAVVVVAEAIGVAPPGTRWTDERPASAPGHVAGAQQAAPDLDHRVVVDAGGDRLPVDEPELPGAAPGSRSACGRDHCVVSHSRPHVTPTGYRPGSVHPVLGLLVRGPHARPRAAGGRRPRESRRRRGP